MGDFQKNSCDLDRFKLDKFARFFQDLNESESGGGRVSPVGSSSLSDRQFYK
jgi:hypothetical protein